MPDGSITTTERLTAIVDGARPVCPRCNRPLRITVPRGWLVVTCSNEMRRPRRCTCAEKLLVIGATEVAIVISLSREEADEARQLAIEGAPLAQVVQRYGVLEVPLLSPRSAA